MRLTTHVPTNLLTADVGLILPCALAVGGAYSPTSRLCK